MKAKSAAALAVAGLFLSIGVPACRVSHDPAAFQQAQNKDFLDILDGPLRSKYSDAELLDEGRKACDAFAQGQTREQVEQMVAADLKLQPGHVGQFMGGLYGGLDCHPQ